MQALRYAHRVDLIAPMFNINSIYQSTGVGDQHGAAAIAEMMREFFGRYPDVRWATQGYRCQGREVTFDLAMTASIAESGEVLVRKGIERLAFDESGSITHIQVIAS